MVEITHGGVWFNKVSELVLGLTLAGIDRKTDIK